MTEIITDRDRNKKQEKGRHRMTERKKNKQKELKRNTEYRQKYK